MNSEYVLEADQTAIQYMNGLGWVGKKEKLRLSSTFWDMKNRMSELLYVVKRSRVGGGDQEFSFESVQFDLSIRLGTWI